MRSAAPPPTSPTEASSALLPLFALLAFWQDVELARCALRSVASDVTAVVAADGPFEDVCADATQARSQRAEQLEREGREQMGDRFHLLEPRVWASEGGKRQALLEAAQSLAPQGWALWLDSDEVLRNGLRLRRLLNDLPASAKCFPLPFLDDDGRVVAANWKLVRYDESSTWEGRGYFFQTGGKVYDLSSGNVGVRSDGPEAWPLLAAAPHLVHRPYLRPPQRVRLGTMREGREPAPAVADYTLPY